MVEYSDYECPYCQRLQTTMQHVVKAYGTDVAWIYRYFPLSFHQNAEKEAEAAECVAQLGGNTAFWKILRQDLRAHHLERHRLCAYRPWSVGQRGRR